jgi:hypothetical protein
MYEIEIQLKENKMQINEENIKNLFANMLWIFFFKTTQIQKDTFPCMSLIFKNGLYRFQLKTVPSDDDYDLWNLMLSSLKQLRWITVALIYK